MRKLGLCSIFDCTRQAVEEIHFAGGGVGEYCRRHFTLRLAQERGFLCPTCGHYHGPKIKHEGVGHEG